MPRLIVGFGLCAILLHSGAHCDALYAQPRTAVPARIDTARQIDTGEFHMSKSPLEAVLLSAAVPGLGQIYLDQTWKVPIIWGLVGGFLYGAVIQNGRYHDAQHSVDTSYADSNLFYAHQWEGVREFYRDDRDKWIIYIGIAYIATLLDAYIAANLYDFDVSDPRPVLGSYYHPADRSFGMTLNLRF